MVRTSTAEGMGAAASTSETMTTSKRCHRVRRERKSPRLVPLDVIGARGAVDVCRQNGNALIALAVLYRLLPIQMVMR